MNLLNDTAERFQFEMKNIFVYKKKLDQPFSCQRTAQKMEGFHLGFLHILCTGNFSYTPEKHQETSGFLKLSRDVKEIAVTKWVSENIYKAHNKI